MIFVNFKTYQEGTGENALDLVKIIQEVVEETQIKIIPVVQATDVKEITQIAKLEIWVQSIDPIDYGAHTGGILPEAVLEDGASGTFLNHSENRFDDFEKLRLVIKRCSELGLKTLVFVANIDELKEILKMKPTFIAYEPPDLVGSTKTSVIKEKGKVIIESVELARKEGTPFIVGAGIKSTEDIRKSLEFGAVGVAVASSIVKSGDPKEKLLDLAAGFGA